VGLRLPGVTLAGLPENYPECHRNAGRFTKGDEGNRFATAAWWKSLSVSAAPCSAFPPWVSQQKSSSLVSALSCRRRASVDALTMPLLQGFRRFQWGSLACCCFAELSVAWQAVNFRPGLAARPRTGARGRLVSQRGSTVEDKLHIPSSPELVGDLSPFRDEHPPTDCFECGRRGHFGFVCPERFRLVLGVSLSGFRPDGARDPSAWDGNIPGARSRKSFLRLIRDHRLLPHPGSPLCTEVLERGLPPPLARRSLRGAPGLRGLVPLWSARRVGGG
jgi:hypothetical protein